MNIGIDIDVCRKVKCKYYKDGCNLEECTCVNRVDGRYLLSQCPVPNKCPYKALHIVRGFPITVAVDCSKECWKRKDGRAVK